MKTDDPPQIQIVNQEDTSAQIGSLFLKRIGVCFGLFIVVGLVNGAIGVQLPDLRRFYRVDNATVGLLYLTETLGYAFSAFCSGILVHKLGLRRFVLAGLVIFALSCLVLGFAPTFGVVLVVRFGVGFGSAIMENGANLFVAALPRPTALLNYLHSLFGAGSLIGPLVATFILTAGWGWNSVYLVWLFLSLPLLLGASLVLAVPTTSSTVQAESGNKPMRATLALPVVWWGSIFLVVYVGVELGMGAWAYTFLTEARFYDPVFSGWVVSGYWLGLTLGRLLLAPLTERLNLGSRGLIQTGFGLAGIGLLVVWWWPGEPASVMGLGLLGLGLGPVFPTMLAILARLVSRPLLPSTIGFATGLSILGATIFPAVAGLVVAWFGLSLFMPYILGLGLLMVATWLIFLTQAGSKL